MNTESLHALSVTSLRTLSTSMRQGILAMGIVHSAVQQAAGASASDVEVALRELAQQGMSPPQIAVVLDAIADEKVRHQDISQLFDLVLSGPDFPGVPTQDTGAVVQSLISKAQTEVLLITYAIHDGAQLFKPLAARMMEIPALKVSFCVHIGRTPSDTSNDAQIVSRYASEFRARH